MKKRIICGSIAIVLTGLSLAIFTAAEPRIRDRAPITAPKHDANLLAVYHYGRAPGPAGKPTPSYLSTDKRGSRPVAQFPAA
jgi:hypothetical protein